MKKHLLFLSLAFAAITAYGQDSIPNGDFETWNSATYDYPENYPYTSNIEAFSKNLPSNEVKTTPGFHGSSAVMLTTGIENIGYFINIDPNNSGENPTQWTGGMLITEKPTGIRGYYKYNVETADSGLLIIAFSKASVNIGTYFCKIGGIKNEYTLFDFTFNPALPDTPDSVAFGAVSSDITVSDNGVAGSTLIIDSVSFTGVTSQPALMNGDFESWQEGQTPYTLTDWYGSDSWSGITKTTDKVAGDYALELTTYLAQHNGSPEARPAFLSNVDMNNNSGNNMMGGIPFSNQIDTLAFYYKYLPSGIDSALVNLTFKYGANIIGGIGAVLHEKTEYEYIEFPFNIGQFPDTVAIQIMSSMGQNTSLSCVGSVLTIDEIQFKSHPLTTNIFNYKNNNNISIFPNPSNGIFTINNTNGIKQINVYNVLGENIYTTNNLKQQTSNEIDLSKFQKGIYFVKIFDGEKNHTEKVVIK
ncbi:MAG: T9SS type A sorting domain-containing protein [Bacteroidetes bacterium]|nr:T9SS type A sorting domain-containing protein [Bacteroidota bacterium]